MTRLWRVVDGDLKSVAKSTPEAETTLEGWIENDPSILGLDAMIIARQLTTDFGGRVDLLGIDREGDLTVIELKRDRTPREVVAQILDSASWINSVTTKRIHEIASDYLGKPLYAAFKDHFGVSMPDNLNTAHNMVIVAAELDPSSKRIVEYLAEKHGVSINTAFFTYFRDGEIEYFAADWLMDQDQVVDRSDEKTKAPWKGYYYVNAGIDEDVRVWEDMQSYGFIAAGYGSEYSGQLNRLSLDAPIFVYQKGAGYIGYGIVRSLASKAKDFVTLDGRNLTDVELGQPNILHNRDDPELAEFLVGVEWRKTFPISEAKWLDRIFTNRNVVCKLRHPATLDFLTKAFAPEEPQ